MTTQELPAPTVNLKEDGTVRRFFHNPETGDFIETARGAWVRYVDHAAVLARAAVPAVQATDEQIEALIEESDGHWKEDVFCIGGPELMALLRAVSVLAAPQSRPGDAATARDAALADGLRQVRHPLRVSLAIVDAALSSTPAQGDAPLSDDPCDACGVAPSNGGQRDADRR